MVKARTVQYSNPFLDNNFLHRKKIMKKFQRNMKTGNQWEKSCSYIPEFECVLFKNE